MYSSVQSTPYRVLSNEISANPHGVLYSLAPSLYLSPPYGYDYSSYYSILRSIMMILPILHVAECRRGCGHADYLWRDPHNKHISTSFKN
jgi:hypothetical protein